MIPLLLTASIIVLAACGDDSDDPAAVPPADSTLPPVDETTTPATDGGFVHPTGADDVVVRIGYEGGFVPVEVSFTSLPTVLVSGDSVYQQGPVPAIYPGPLLPNIQVQSITGAGIQSILALADGAGLLQEIEYVQPDNIADAPDTVVTIDVDGSTYVHRAYALGMAGGSDGGETDPARIALADFIADVQAYVNDPVNGEVSEASTFEATTYLIQSYPVDDTSGYDVEPTFVEWPAEVSVRLADAAECAAMPAPEVSALFADSNQLTFFTEDGVTYKVAVKPQLPGDAC
ncbi:MAG TPA: hypothetical protein VGK49_08340 [Ilumatobacteraceae bacterium]